MYVCVCVGVRACVYLYYTYSRATGTFTVCRSVCVVDDRKMIARVYKGNYNIFNVLRRHAIRICASRVNEGPTTLLYIMHIYDTIGGEKNNNK